jgi:cyclin B
VDRIQTCGSSLSAVEAIETDNELVYKCLREREKNMHPRTKFLSRQDGVTDRMRTILVDWLVEVHKMLQLFPETLFLSVAIVDKYLSIKNISSSQMQLVGISSLMLSSEYQEVEAPELKDFAFVSTCSSNHILAYRQNILASLGFEISLPSSINFLTRFSKAAGSDRIDYNLSKYICEIALLSLPLLKYLPSEIAAGSVYLARVMTIRFPVWTPTLEHYTNCTTAHARTIALELNDFVGRVRRSNMKATFKKYHSANYEAVANITLVNSF